MQRREFNSSADNLTTSVWLTWPKHRYGGVKLLGQFWPTKKSSKGNQKLVVIRWFASQCANGCCESLLTRRDFLAISTPLIGVTRSRQCSEIGSDAAKVR